MKSRQISILQHMWFHSLMITMISANGMQVKNKDTEEKVKWLFLLQKIRNFKVS